jgi:hypothetical protein
MTGIYQVIVEPDPLLVPEKESTRMLMRILAGFAVMAVGFVVVVALQPSRYRIARRPPSAPPHPRFSPK